MKRWIVLGLCAGAIVLVACAKTTSEVEPLTGLVSGTGTMLVTGDCHGWHIKSDAGPYYEVLDLAEEFQQSDLRVRFTLRVRHDVASTCMMGPAGDVVSMSRL